VFYLNLPLGLVALVLLVTAYRPAALPSTMSKRFVDYTGAATLVAGLAPLLMALSLGGHELAWTSPLLLGRLAFSGAMLLEFVLVPLTRSGFVAAVRRPSREGLAVGAVLMFAARLSLVSNRSMPAVWSPAQALATERVPSQS